MADTSFGYRHRGSGGASLRRIPFIGSGGIGLQSLCRGYLFWCLLAATPGSLHAQSAGSLIQQLRGIHDSLSGLSSATGQGNILSNKAMNIFLSNKVGTYLSDYNDLSLYKNYITFGTADGTFSVNHNLRQPPVSDQPVRSFMVLGARADIIDAIVARGNHAAAVNNFGITLRHTWMGRYHTSFRTANNGSLNQKQYMDAQRSIIVARLATEIRNEDSVFTKQLQQAGTGSRGSDSLHIALALRSAFEVQQQQAFAYAFADQQSQALLASNNYKRISTSWTSIGVYLPLLNQRFHVAPSVSAPFQTRRNYPFELSLTHARFFDGPSFGRLFLRFNATVFNNNAYRSQALQSLSFADYRLLGGVDTASQHNSEVLVGDYTNFITPQLNVNAVYIPPDWHLGISVFAAQNFGSYQALNGRIGLPVVLVTRRGDPDITFEFQVRFFDVANKVQPRTALADKTTIGFSIGVPFSKIVY